MKRTVLLPLLVTLLLTLTASAARAAPFTLTLIDTTGGCLICPTVTRTDNLSPDLLLATPDRMTFGNIVLDSFTVATGIELTQYGTAGSPAAPVEMILPLTFRVSSTQAGTFEVILFHGDLSSPLLGSSVQASVISNASAGSNVSFTSWVDPTNHAFQLTQPAGSTQVASSGNNATYLSAPIAITQPFSLYTKLDFVFGAGGGSVTASSDLAIINAVATPEPSTNLLFGSGLALLGLALFGRRRSGKGKFQLFLERGFAMKKTALLPVLVALLLAFNAAPARANFILTVSDVTAGVTHTINDNDALVPDPDSPFDSLGDFDSTNDAITTMGAIGKFDFQFTQAAISVGGTTFCLTAKVCMDLNSVLITNTGQTGGEFKATLLRTGLDAASLGLGANVQSRTDVLVTAGSGAVATGTFTSFINGVAVPTDGNLSQIVPIGSTFSMYSTLDIVFSNGGGVSASADSNTSVFNAVATPEPSTMALFGSGLGLFGLASMGRRRSKKNAV